MRLLIGMLLMVGAIAVFPPRAEALSPAACIQVQQYIAQGEAAIVFLDSLVVPTSKIAVVAAKRAEYVAAIAVAQAKVDALRALCP